MEFLSYLISGVSLGSVYAIIALGYTMVYGIAKMLNFAHGDVIMVGGYISLLAMTNLGLPWPVAVLLAMLVCTVLGVVIEGLAYRPLRSAPSLAVLITAIGVSYFLQNAAQLIWGASPRSYTPIISGSLNAGTLSISYVSLLTIVMCIVIMAGLTAFTSKSKMGKAMRACSEDKGAAQLMGINVNRTISANLCHRQRARGHRRSAALLLQHLAHAHNRLHARHQGLHGGGVRRYRLHPRRVPRRHPSRRDRGAGQGVHLHAAGQLHSLRRADNHAAGAPRGPARQICAGESLR